MDAELEGQFREFARGQAAPLRRFAYLLCGDWHSADDLVQSALIKLYRAWPRLSEREMLTRYAQRTVLRCWLDERRKPWRRSESRDGEIPDVADHAADLGLHGDRAVDRELLGQALRDLAPKQRAVVVLRFWQQLSIPETATVMNCSEGNVKSQQSRALARLRTYLDPSDLVNGGARSAS